jgi:hypothetical protein
VFNRLGQRVERVAFTMTVEQWHEKHPDLGETVQVEGANELLPYLFAPLSTT